MQNCPHDSGDITTFMMAWLSLSIALDCVFRMRSTAEPHGHCGDEQLPDLVLRKFLEARS